MLEDLPTTEGLEQVERLRSELCHGARGTVVDRYDWSRAKSWVTRHGCLVDEDGRLKAAGRISWLLRLSHDPEENGVLSSYTLGELGCLQVLLTDVSISKITVASDCGHIGIGQLIVGLLTAEALLVRTLRRMVAVVWTENRAGGRLMERCCGLDDVGFCMSRDLRTIEVPCRQMTGDLRKPGLAEHTIQGIEFARQKLQRTGIEVVFAGKAAATVRTLRRRSREKELV